MRTSASDNMRTLGDGSAGDWYFTLRTITSTGASEAR
jgi:hypothetical protein